jgi:NAD kinase
MDKSWQRVGVIVNPTAGRASTVSLAAARRVAENLGAKVVLTGEGDLGAEAFSGWPGELRVHPAGNEIGCEKTRRVAQWISEQTADTFLVVGGDGTIAEVARILMETGSRIPIVGVGAGSTNAGRLITCRAAQAGDLRPEDLEIWNADCLVASRNGQLLGLGFNDVVIAYTVVGTIDGKRLDLDAAEHIRGRLVPGEPRSIGKQETKVSKICGTTVTRVAEGEGVGTVVAGFAEPAFFGKAITGGVCLTVLAGLPAGCVVSASPLVRVGVSAQEILDAPPVVSRYVSLSDQTAIIVENTNEGAALCADGNPLCLLASADRVEITIRTGAVAAVRSKRDLRSS